MKLFNIFKKEKANQATSNVQKLDKNQLNKVIGGTDVTFVVDEGKKGLNAVNVK